MRTVIVISADGSQTEYALEDAPTILDAFSAAGFKFPHGCRVGCCGACLSEIIEGAQELDAPDTIETERLKEMIAQKGIQAEQSPSKPPLRFTCRTALNGDITIRPLSGSVQKK